MWGAAIVGAGSAYAVIVNAAALPLFAAIADGATAVNVGLVAIQLLVPAKRARVAVSSLAVSTLAVGVGAAELSKRAERAGAATIDVALVTVDEGVATAGADPLLADRWRAIATLPARPAVRAGTARAAAAVDVTLVAILDAVGTAGRDAAVAIGAGATRAVGSDLAAAADAAARTELAAAVHVSLVVILNSIGVQAAVADPGNTGGAGAVGGHEARTTGRTTGARLSAAVDVRLVLVLYSVVAPDADTGGADSAGAVPGYLAVLTVRAGRTGGAATVDVGFVLISDSIPATDAASARTDSALTVLRCQAMTTVRARQTRCAPAIHVRLVAVDRMVRARVCEVRRLGQVWRRRQIATTAGVGPHAQVLHHCSVKGLVGTAGGRENRSEAKQNARLRGIAGSVCISVTPPHDHGVILRLTARMRQHARQGRANGRRAPTRIADGRGRQIGDSPGQSCFSAFLSRDRNARPSLLVRPVLPVALDVDIVCDKNIYVKLTVREYLTADGRSPFREWLEELNTTTGRRSCCSSWAATRARNRRTSKRHERSGKSTRRRGEMARRSKDWNAGLAHDLQDPAFAREFLLAAVEEGVSVQVALGKVIRAIGVKEYADRVGIAGPNILRAINPRHNPTQATLNRLLEPFGLRLSLSAIPKGKRRRAA